MSLDLDTSHTFPADPPAGEWMECEDCGMPLPPREKPRSKCSGLNQRSGGLQRSGGSLQRSKPISPVADGGRKNRHDPETGVKHTYGPVWEWISKNLPCCVCGTLDGAPADHWKTVKTGGKDPGNLLALCADHQGRHDMGHKTWATAHRIDPVETAMEAWRAFERAKPELAEKLEDHLPERRAA